MQELLVLFTVIIIIVFQKSTKLACSQINVKAERVIPKMWYNQQIFSDSKAGKQKLK
jgi:hypothetical protein